MSRRAPSARRVGDAGDCVAEKFRILTVCTGNICRSPLAEQLLARGLSDIDEIVVSSAGTHAMVGGLMTEQSQDIARNLGIAAPEAHEPRLLTEQILDSSDLVLALARDHRKAIVQENPRVSRRVFTLREFARLSDATTDEDLRWELNDTSRSAADRLRAAVRAVTAGRATALPPSELTEDDVVDPYRRSDATYSLSTEQIVPAVNTSLAFLRRALEAEL